MDLAPYERMVKLLLTDGERTAASALADTLLAEVGRLAGLDTEGVRPLVNALGLTDAMRDDVAVRGFDRGSLLSGAPGSEDGYVRVKGVLN